MKNRFIKKIRDVSNYILLKIIVKLFKENKELTNQNIDLKHKLSDLERENERMFCNLILLETDEIKEMFQERARPNHDDETYESINDIPF